MTQKCDNQDMGQRVVGRANRDGARLFREWYRELTGVAENGGQSAYVFVMGSFNEILKTFDLPVVFPEINSLQTAVRRVAHEYLDEAEDYGFSTDICGYVKADFAVQLRRGVHPMGRIPKPSVVVATNACNTYVKWAEIWERMHHVPIVTIDVPGTRRGGVFDRPGSRRFENDRRYVEGQVRELIVTCEQVTGTGFDLDRLREVLGYRQPDESLLEAGATAQSRAALAVQRADRRNYLSGGRQRATRHGSRSSLF